MFVTFEGPEGAGKSTVMKEVASRLMARGINVVVTREPGDGPVGARIREILLGGADITPHTELFLFLADRAQHVESMIVPALENGATVLCDRYADSTLVYQGYGRDLDIDLLRQLNQAATGGLEPNLTLLLDLPAEVGLARLKNKDRLDKEPIDFHRRVREGFLREAEEDPVRWVVIDAMQPVDQVIAACERAVSERAARYAGVRPSPPA